MQNSTFKKREVKYMIGRYRLKCIIVLMKCGSVATVLLEKVYVGCPMDYAKVKYHTKMLESILKRV